MGTNIDRFLSTKEVAQRLAVDVDVVNGWCEAHTIEAHQLPGVPDGGYRISERAFEAFLRATLILPLNEQIPLEGALQALSERLLQGTAPTQPIKTASNDTLRIFINRPTVQRIEAQWTQGSRTGSITVMFWPADTLTQARRFWDKVNLPAFLALRHNHHWLGHPWTIAPVPHISFSQTHLVYWAEGGLALESYCDFWHAHPEAMRQYGRNEGGPDFGALQTLLSQVHAFDDKAREEFQKGFLDTKRQAANLIPGLYMDFTLPYEEARQLDAEGSLVGKLRDQIDTAMATWGECLP